MKTLMYMFLGFGLGFNASGILIPDIQYNIWGTICVGLGIVFLFANDIIESRKKLK